jgi:FkbH-like protein
MTLSGVAQELQKSLSWEVLASDFNSWLPDVLNKGSELHRSKPDFLLVVLSSRFVEGDSHTGDLQRFFEAVRGWDGTTKILFTTIVPDPILPQPLVEGGRLAKRAALINEKLFEFQKTCSFFHVVELQSFFTLHGLSQIHDARYEAIARMYFSPRGATLLAKHLARYLKALVTTPRKVLALDLDNTLWGGILGEDGFDGIKIGGENLGYSFLRFQKHLKRLKENGILLVICSKNNEEEALNVFRKHPDMLLRLDDFVGYRINWQSKAENLKSLAKELSLGIDSFVYFDDTAFEREQMRSMLPQVDTIEVPKDPADYVRALWEYPGFDLLRVTDEDRARSEMYRAESKRKDLEKSSDSLEDFYQSLEMSALITRADEKQLDRVFQLVHRTNQFNLTTLRHTENELTEILRSKSHHVFLLRLKDKLGESGITGLAIIKEEKKSWIMENLILSCRIIGRTVEFGFVRWLVENAKPRGIEQIVGRFVPTKKNQVAAGFLEKAGFKGDSSTDKYVLDIAQFPKNSPKDFLRFES